MMKYTRFTKASRNAKHNQSIIDVNYTKLDKLINSVAMKFVLSGYRESLLYGK